MNSNVTLGEIDKLKRELDALRPLKPEAERKLWKKLRLEWSYNSNHIEGNTLTYGETELLLIKGRTTGDHDLREYEEMKAHDLAVQEVREWATDESRDLTETDIRQLNKTILKEPFWKEAITEDGQPTRKLIKIGEYKEQHNSVRLQNGEIFHYPSPEETPAMMRDLMKWYKDNQHLHPVELAALFHYKFVCIHPFDDGNGRVARLVMNYILMKAGYVPLIIKSKDKAQYLNALNKADIGELNKFVEYIQDQLPWSFNLSIKAAKGESIDEPGDLDKKINLLNHTIEGKIDIVEKNDHYVSEILKGVYTAVIKQTDERADKLKHFFAAKQYVFIQESPEKGKINLLEYEGQGVDSIIKYYLTRLNDTSIRHSRYKISLYLSDYKKSTKKFSVEICFRITFSEYTYQIACSVSYPGESGPMTRQFKKLIKKLDEDDSKNGSDIIEINLGEWKYLEAIDDSILATKADEISNRAIEFIEEKIKNLKE